MNAPLRKSHGNERGLRCDVFIGFASVDQKSDGKTVQNDDSSFT